MMYVLDPSSASSKGSSCFSRRPASTIRAVSLSARCRLYVCEHRGA